MVITGVPAAIPGLLNVVLADENPANRPYYDPAYRYAYSATFPLYNPDLPGSPQNLFPKYTAFVDPPDASQKGTPP
jgi:hypothetical protein